MKTILYIAALLSGVAAFAQNLAQTSLTKSKSFIGLTGGYSHLMGNLTHSGYADSTSGYANSNGFNFGVEGAYYFHKNIGIGGVYSNTSFFTNGIQTLADGYKEDFDVDSTTVNVSGKYAMNDLLIGPYFSFPFKKLTFDFRAVAGVVLMKTPTFTTYLEDQQNATFSQESSKASAFAWQAGMGIRYSLLENLGLKLNADYFYTKPDFSITNTNRANNAGRLITSYHQPVSMLHFNLGIAYLFGSR